MDPQDMKDFASEFGSILPPTKVGAGVKLSVPFMKAAGAGGYVAGRDALLAEGYNQVRGIGGPVVKG